MGQRKGALPSLVLPPPHFVYIVMRHHVIMVCSDNHSWLAGTPARIQQRNELIIMEQKRVPVSIHAARNLPSLV